MEHFKIPYWFLGTPLILFMNVIYLSIPGRIWPINIEKITDFGCNALFDSLNKIIYIA